MSIFDETNRQAEDSVAPAAFGPTADFFQGFALAYEAHVRTSSQQGLEHFFEKMDEEQAQRWGSKVDGGKAPRLRDVADFERIAQYMVEGIGLSPEEVSALENYDTAVKRANDQGRSLLSSRELFGNVVTRAQEAERDAANMPVTWTGAIGQFAGGTIASLDPRTDPFNFWTLGVGGVGKTIAARIGTQMGAQGFIETMNQITGVQENRRIMGLEHGFVPGLIQVGSTALGAGVLQGLGEGGVVIARRWFGSPTRATSPGDRPNPELEEPLPPPPRREDPIQGPLTLERFEQELEAIRQEQLALSPWRGSPGAARRTEQDLGLMRSQLESWQGPRPWEADPLGTTALARVLDIAAEDRVPAGIRASTNANVDTMAREIDPTTFAFYDDFVARKQNLQAMLEDVQTDRQAAAMSQVEDLQDEIARLRGRQAVATKRQAKKLETRIEKLEAERDKKVETITSRDTPEQAQTRERLVKVDEQMRTMAPLISRAYAKARGQWDASQEELEGVVQMMRDARTRRLESEVPPRKEPEQPAPSPVAQRLAKHPDVLAERGPNDSGADVMAKILEQEGSIVDEGVESFRVAARAFEPEGDTVRLEGYDYEVPLDDKIAVPTEDGTGTREVTVRDLIEETKQDEAELQAVTACSTRQVS